MACQEYRDLMMASVDDELDDTERKRFKAHLQTCSDCAREYQDFQGLKTMTDGMALAEPEDRIWDSYWNQVYNRAERGVGWILFSIAAIGLLIYGGFCCLENLITNNQIEITLKCLLLVLIVGTSILFVSIARERLFFWKHDRYKNVRR